MVTKKKLSKLMNLVLEPLGFELRQKRFPKRKVPRHTLRAALDQVKELGFHPSTVIDVGAAHGTREIYEQFPEAKLFLVEPLLEFKPYIDKIVEEFPNAEYVIAAADSKAGSVSINVHEDLYGSSLFLENEGSDIDGQPRNVPAITLDQSCRERNFAGPFLLKIDVQGNELNVLKGSIRILKETEYAVLEVSLFKFFVGGPSLLDVINFMKNHGFVVYDIFGPQYRLLDNAMSQCDMAFVKENGIFRKYHNYATKIQRKNQNLLFQEKLSKL